MKKKILFLTILLTFLLVPTFVIGAYSYNYDFFKNPIYSSEGLTFKDAIGFSEMFKNDNFTRDCLRMIVSDIKNQTVNANPQKEITNDVCLKILQKSAKTHKDSIEQFKSAGRVELVEKEFGSLFR